MHRARVLVAVVACLTFEMAAGVLSRGNLESDTARLHTIAPPRKVEGGRRQGATFYGKRYVAAGSGPDSPSKNRGIWEVDPSRFPRMRDGTPSGNGTPSHFC